MDEATQILALSALHEVETSALDRTKLDHMLAQSFCWATSGSGRDGYVITFDQNAKYEGVHFGWFKARYPTFVYVDRIVVATHAQGKGIARAFYKDVMAQARRAGHQHLVCEINVQPSNPASFAFHHAMGFKEIGRAHVGSDKTVSYQALDL